MHEYRTAADFSKEAIGGVIRSIAAIKNHLFDLEMELEDVFRYAQASIVVRPKDQLQLLIPAKDQKKGICEGPATEKLQIAHDWSRNLTEAKFEELSDLLRNSEGASKISLNKQALLVDSVCSAIVKYPPGADGIAFIDSIRLLLTKMQAA